MKKQWLLAAVVAMAMSAPALAEDRARRDANMADLTASYSVQQSDIQNLRDKGWSWSDIGTALAVSKRSGQPLQELVAQKDSGMSWNQIADRNGFKLNEVQREAKQVAKDFKRADKEARRGEAIQTTPTETVPGATPGTDRTDADRVGPGTETDPTGTRSPTSQAPNYPQNPSGPGDSQSPSPNGNP
jgi:hypothetical protein